MRIRYSVIIPVYNREKTLARCLESLTCQNREDVQILVIDDGSRDGSGRIAREFAAKFGCVTYHFQENAGVSAARNAGLELAVGEYVTFVDSDDYVSGDYFSVLDCAAEKGGWDLLVFREEGVGGPFQDETALFAQLEACPDSASRLKLLLSSRGIMYPHNKCFVNRIIREHGLRFLPGQYIGEDFSFCMAYAAHARSICVEDSVIYSVDLSDQNSLSRKYRPDLDAQIIRAFGYVAQTVRESQVYRQERETLLAILDYLYVKNVCTCIAERFKAGKTGYWRNRREIAQICRLFRQPLGESRCGTVHRAMRLLLKWKLYVPFYVVTAAVKGRRAAKNKE